jgi:transcription antitermination factor NusG
VDASWYAVQLRCRFERIVAAQLQRKDIETFLPTIREVHCWSDRQQVIEKPLFQGYGFVRVSACPDIHLRVLQTAGVIGFVASNGKAVPVPEHQIESVRLLISELGSCAVCPFVKAGQRVRIEGGCLDGVEGIFVRYQGKDSLVVSIEAIERSMVIQVQGYNLRVV